MFKALEAFRGQVDSIHLTVAFASGSMLAVTVAPKITDEAAKKNPGLAQPFCFTASAEDLEAGFVQALAEVSMVRKGLADQAAAQAAALGSAKTALTKLPAPALPSPAAATSGAAPVIGQKSSEPVTITGADALFDGGEE